MNVLSLFDGMSCGQIALNRVGINYINYFSSEIDEYAIKVTQKNYPQTIQLGDINHIKFNELPKIDLLIAGSPCQGFSFAGKQLNFNDDRSKLFFNFVDALNILKPKHFLLENVKMKKDYQNIISSYLGVEPIEINSNLVSAQNRKRLYWTNIENIEQPQNQHIYLDMILEDDVDEIYYLSEEEIEKNNLNKFLLHEVKNVVFTERRTEEAKKIRREYRKKYNRDFSPRRAKELVPRTDNKCNCLTTSLTKEHILFDETLTFRRLTPIECERLQNVDDNYTLCNGVSTTQRYKMLGNGWTVNVITHIFKNI